MPSLGNCEKRSVSGRSEASGEAERQSRVERLLGQIVKSLEC